MIPKFQTKDIFIYPYEMRDYTFHMEGIEPAFLGDITIGMLSNGDSISYDDSRMIIRYKDGTKYTINFSWFD